SDNVWRGFFVIGAFWPKKQLKPRILLAPVMVAHLLHSLACISRAVLSRSPRRTFAATSHFLALSIRAVDRSKFCHG
ncbi:hypothetical protein, partial [Pseudomonas savastanoi]|uniref:hypothetical protein n=2 Tax=Pseudomonas syringae group TaxID=136849 RepID=UPI001CC1EFFF